MVHQQVVDGLENVVFTEQAGFRHANWQYHFPYYSLESCRQERDYGKRIDDAEAPASGCSRGDRRGTDH